MNQYVKSFSTGVLHGLRQRAEPPIPCAGPRQRLLSRHWRIGPPAAWDSREIKGLCIRVGDLPSRRNALTP
jgi:hypothetical protein